MKEIRKTIFSSAAMVLVGLGLLSACQQTTTKQSATVKDSTTAPKENMPMADSTGTTPLFATEGTVKATVPGKDGYMATLTGKNGKTYIITMSIMRLEKAYKQLNIGDQVKVSGDTVHLNDQINILVKTFELNK